MGTLFKSAPGGMHEVILAPLEGRIANALIRWARFGKARQRGFNHYQSVYFSKYKDNKVSLIVNLFFSLLTLTLTSFSLSISPY